MLPATVAAVVMMLRLDPDIQALLTDSEDTVKVFNNVPVGTVPPYLWVLSGEEYDPRRKLGAGHYARGCTIVVRPVSRHRGTKEIDELGSLAMIALERQPFAVPGYLQAGIVWESSGLPGVMEAEGGPQFLRDVIFRASAR